MVYGYLQAMMENKMVVLVILCCTLIHTCLAGVDIFLFHTTENAGIILLLSCKVVSYLLYPLLGWMADVCFTRYKFVLFSFIAIILGSILAIISSTLAIIFPQYHFYLYYPLGLSIIIALLGIGLFESTAIQFGMDQMLEASSDKLSTFIHWYYWSSNLGRVVALYISYVIIIYYHQSTVNLDANNTILDYEVNIANTVVVFGAGLPLICSVIALCVLVHYKSQLVIDEIGEHPLKLIYEVLSYAWKHTCPENRSAFTYWEEDIPPRIDLGKSKYGGPFSTEEVEDTKSFFRIVLLLFTLIEFHLPVQGFSQQSQLTRRQCPNMEAFILGDPTNITLITIIIGMPLYQLVFIRYCKKNKCLHNNMLKRVGLGMLCCLLKEIARIIIYATTIRDKTCRKVVGVLNPIVSCYLTTSNNNGTLPIYHDTCKTNDFPFLLTIIPNFLHGLSFLLVFMTILEFICAQAPLRLKGLLIGIWYALMAIRYLPVTPFTKEATTYEVLVVHEVKIFLIFLSLMLYLCVSRRYRYRLRDEVVQEQFLVEEIYERELAHQTELEHNETMKCANYGTLNK